MTGIFSESVVETMRWDSIERRIIGSALALRATNQKALAAISDGVAKEEVTTLDPVLLGTAVQVSYRPTANGDEILALISIEAKLYYNATPALLSGLNVKQNLIPYSVLPPSVFVASNPSVVATPIPPVIPSEVETLEQFFLHNLNLLGEYIYPDIKYFGSQLFDGASPPYLSVTINLPLDYRIYCRTQNALEASKRVVLSFPSTSTSAINNTFPVNNILAFKN
jgi:hypothetical protein